MNLLSLHLQACFPKKTSLGLDHLTGSGFIWGLDGLHGLRDLWADQSQRDDQIVCFLVKGRSAAKILLKLASSYKRLNCFYKLVDCQRDSFLNRIDLQPFQLS